MSLSRRLMLSVNKSASCTVRLLLTSNQMQTVLVKMKGTLGNEGRKVGTFKKKKKEKKENVNAHLKQAITQIIFWFVNKSCQTQQVTLLDIFNGHLWIFPDVRRQTSAIFHRKSWSWWPKQPNWDVVNIKKNIQFQLLCDFAETFSVNIYSWGLVFAFSTSLCRSVTWYTFKLLKKSTGVDNNINDG